MNSGNHNTMQMGLLTAHAMIGITSTLPPSCVSLVLFGAGHAHPLPIVVSTIPTMVTLTMGLTLILFAIQQAATLPLGNTVCTVGTLCLGANSVRALMYVLSAGVQPISVFLRHWRVTAQLGATM